MHKLREIHVTQLILFIEMYEILLRHVCMMMQEWHT